MVPYKERPTIYSPTAKDPQKRLVYNRVIEMLNDGEDISHIAKENREKKFATFEPVSAKYVKLEITNGFNGYASTAEVEVLGY